MASHSTPSRAARVLPWALLLALASFPLLAPGFGLDYYVGFVRHALIVMIAATSLNFILGYGGMAALGHAGFIGVGAYTVVALVEAGFSSAWLAWGGALVVAGLSAALIGVVTTILMCVTAAGQSVAFPNVGAMISRSADPHRQAQIMGLNNAGGALVSDHSMPITLSNDYTALSGGCNGFSGTATVTFTATDRWGNSSSSIATLSAMDTIPPVWEILPQSVEIACSEDLPTRLADWLLDNGGGEVSDACGTVAVTYAYELSGACTDSTLVTFIAVDECGNTAQIQAYFIVSNSLPPAITAPASDLILPCDAPDLPVRIQQWLLEHGGAQAEGACSSVSWRHVLGQPTPGCGNTSETSVTFIAEDACGNAASLSARIRLVDTVAPVWTAAPENLILYCGAATEATIQVWLQQAGGGAATDACSAIAMSYNYNGLSNGCNPQTGTATVVFTAEDACGNRSTRSAMIEVRDTTPPVWTQLPTPIVLQCGEDLWGAFLPWLANSGGGMVEDDCGTSSITYFYTEQVDCLDPDTLHVVFSGRDACGNVSEITIPVVVLRPTDIYNPAFEISSIRVFPNPARESVQIQWQGAENESFRLQLWNASGHVMTTVEGRGHALELSVAAYSSGVYFFAIETAGGKKGYGRVVRM